MITCRNYVDENVIVNVDSSGVEHRELNYVPVFAADFGITDELTVKVGLSFCDISGALMNLDSEAPHCDFNKYKSENEIAP